MIFGDTSPNVDIDCGPDVKRIDTAITISPRYRQAWRFMKSGSIIRAFSLKLGARNFVLLPKFKHGH